MFHIEARGQNEFTCVDGASDAEIVSMKRLQHPNIVRFVSIEKGVCAGLPACLPISLKEMDVEEIILGLRDLCGALRTRLGAGMFFTELTKDHIGTAVACHPLREHRWVLVRLLSSSSADETSSNLAAQSLFKDILAPLWGIVPKSLRECVEGDLHSNYIHMVEEALIGCPSDLALALEVGSDLPLSYATDPNSLADGYSQIEQALLHLVSAGKMEMVERRVLNWILTPEHVAQPASSKLMSTILALPLSKEGGNKIVGSLLKKSLLSSDPTLNAKLHSFMWVLGPFCSLEVLGLMVLSCHFNIYMLASALERGWLDSTDLRYSCSVIRGMSALTPELLSRCPSGFACEELVKDLQCLLGVCSSLGDETDTDMLKLVKEVLVLLMNLTPCSSTAQSVVSIVIANGCVLQRDHLIHIVNGCLSSLPIDPSFLLSVFSRLAGSKDRSVREAACDGLMLLKGSLRLSLPAALSLPCAVSDEHFNPQGDSFLQCVANFPQLASRYAAPSDVGTLAQLSKIHQKVRPPQSHSNIVFRSGRDAAQFAALLPVGNM